MLSQRPVDPTQDKDFVLEVACMASYESVPGWTRGNSYRAYRDAWFGSSFPGRVLKDLKASLKDEASLVQIWQEDGQPAGLLWVDFVESPQRRLVAAVRDLVVAPEHQRRGIGRMMLQAVETAAREKGAAVLRVETSVENEATQALYQKAGYSVGRLIYEKPISE